MSLFGYTNPDILSRHQKEIKDEYYKVGYTVPWLQSMDNFQETKEKFGEYPKVNKTVIPDEFKEFTINDVAAGNNNKGLLIELNLYQINYIY